ncbi:MAG: transglutaminase-like domain-containing protein [bacterium]|nr:transglutaminase-like domain-containing protein [bacterium]
MKLLRQWGYDIKDLFGLTQYRKKCAYVARYVVSVTNTSSLAQNISIIIPVPSDMPYQVLAEQPRIQGGSTVISREHTYGNRYGVIDATFEAGMTKEFSEFFAIAVAPRKTIWGEKYLLGTYPKKMADECALYLHSDTYINSDDEAVRDLACAIMGSETDIEIILRTINAYVVNNVRYGNPIPGLYSSRDAMTKEVVDCGGFDALFVALARACGIPARIVSGFWAGYPSSMMHAWVEALLPNGEWIVADPSIEHLRKKRRRIQPGYFGYSGSDRIAFSVGCDMAIPVRNGVAHVDILQHPFVVAEKGETSVMTSLTFTTHRLRL